MYQIPRSGRKRGEVAVLYNTALNDKLIKVDRSITTFEFIHCDVSAQHHRFQLYVIYRPPPSKSNNIKTSIFFAEWSEFIDRITVSNDDIVITGHLNFHLDNPSTVFLLINAPGALTFSKRGALIREKISKLTS
jgi:hypothetical protein